MTSLRNTPIEPTIRYSLLAIFRCEDSPKGTNYSNKMKRFIILALAAGMAASAHAQAQQQPFHLGKFVDNWFASTGAGVNTIIDNGTMAPMNPAVDVNIGKWLTPHTVIRLGYQGLRNKAVDTSAGWFAGSDAFGFHYIHLDVMWNPFSSDRFAAGPYFHSGVINTVWNGAVNSEVGIGLGLFAQVRVAGNLSVLADIRPVLAREDAWRGAGKIICFPSATLGVSYAFGLGKKGKGGFERHQRDVEVVRVSELRDCTHEKIIADLQRQLDSLKKAPATVVTKPIDLDYVVYFQLDKSSLLQKERFHLVDLVKNLPAEATLELVGHADKETGNPRHNRKLSEQRVQTVFRALLEMGFCGKMTYEAKGDTANPFDDPFVKNRCVTVKIHVPVVAE